MLTLSEGKREDKTEQEDDKIVWTTAQMCIESLPYENQDFYSVGVFQEKQTRRPAGTDLVNRLVIVTIVQNTFILR
jgi:hypothetical protein